jgi:hypothetical protein
MITSRERLNVAGEVVQPVEPLPLNGPAIELFVVRAQAQRPGFVLDDAQRAAVVEVTSLLDGLPLAIELAAARIAVLSPAQLVLRLRDRFALLAGRGGTGRQATLRAAIDWSWQLLSAWEQSAFEQCSVFEGGFTLAGAEAVVDLAPWPEAPPVVDAMQALLDKSLLRRWVPPQASARQELDEPYFAMYLSIHEYATEKRRQRGLEVERALQLRHGRYFAAFGSDAAIEALATHGGTQRQQALRQELDNLLAACRRAVTRATARSRSRAIALLGRCWPCRVRSASRDARQRGRGDAGPRRPARRDGPDHPLGGTDAGRRWRRAGGRVHAGAGSGASARRSPARRAHPQPDRQHLPLGRPPRRGACPLRRWRSIAFARSVAAAAGEDARQSGDHASRAGSSRRGLGALRGGARDRARDRQPARRGDHALQPG